LLWGLLAQRQSGWDDPSEVGVARLGKLIDGAGYAAAFSIECAISVSDFVRF